MNNKKLMIAIIFVLIFSAFIMLKNTDKYNVNDKKIKSVNLSTDYEIEQTLLDIEKLNANTVNVPVVIEIPNLNSNDMKINDYSKEKAICLIKKLK